MRIGSKLTVFVAFLLSFVVTANAQPVLEIYSKPALQAPRSFELTLDELGALPQTIVNTNNEFVNGIVSFKGPLMRDVFSHLGISAGDTVSLIAANDYRVEIMSSEMFRYDVILAIMMDGRNLSLRDKGPLWVIYPMTDHKELQDPVYNNRLVWQLIKIEVS